MLVGSGESAEYRPALELSPNPTLADALSYASQSEERAVPESVQSIDIGPWLSGQLQNVLHFARTEEEVDRMSDDVVSYVYLDSHGDIRLLRDPIIDHTNHHALPPTLADDEAAKPLILIQTTNTYFPDTPPNPKHNLRTLFYPPASPWADIGVLWLADSRTILTMRGPRTPVWSEREALRNLWVWDAQTRPFMKKVVRAQPLQTSRWSRSRADEKYAQRRVFGLREFAYDYGVRCFSGSPQSSVLTLHSDTSISERR